MQFYISLFPISCPLSPCFCVSFYLSRGHFPPILPSHFVHISSYFRNISQLFPFIRRSQCQYSPNRGQEYHFFPPRSDAIILTQRRQAASKPVASFIHKLFICGLSAPYLRRYCYEEDFCKAAPRQRDEGVWQQSDSLWSLLIPIDSRPSAGWLHLI